MAFRIQVPAVAHMCAFRRALFERLRAVERNAFRLQFALQRMVHHPAQPVFHVRFFYRRWAHNEERNAALFTIPDGEIDERKFIAHGPAIEADQSAKHIVQFADSKAGDAQAGEAGVVCCQRRIVALERRGCRTELFGFQFRVRGPDPLSSE